MQNLFQNVASNSHCSKLTSAPKQVLSYCIFLLCLCLASSSFAADGSNNSNAANTNTQTSSEIFGSPLLERYILDELRSIRQDQLKHEANISKELASRELNVSDRAITYTTNTVNNIFYIITAAATIFVIAGISSLRDAKTKLEELIELRTSKIAIEYEQRLKEIEEELKTRSQEIIDNQESISEANHIHSLWMRTGIETNSRERIRIYDEILTIRPDDIEAITYKADAAIELEEFEWALKLSNQAIEFDHQYALAYWQRACALTGLNEFDQAINDIQKAINHNPSLKEQLESEVAFVPLHELDGYKQLNA